jgi:hypothetical protein
MRLEAGIIMLAMVAGICSSAASSAVGGPVPHKSVHPSAAAMSGTARPVFAGFDKNAYPGDDVIAALSKSFAFTGYWLNNPPGMTSNPWQGKRGFVRAQGLGFVLLFNGRLYADLKAAAAHGQDATALGRNDAAVAITGARQDGFPGGAIIFLDQEEGGHLLPEQAAYVFAWIDAVQSSGPPVPRVSHSKAVQSFYRAGVYCSGIAANANDAGTTADDILQHYKGQRTPVMWVANDECPPAPGCVRETTLPPSAASGTPVAAVWQYAQSPRRAQFTAGCAATTYSPDNACYAPGIPHSANTAVDLDSATSPDPSHGR